MPTLNFVLCLYSRHNKIHTDLVVFFVFIGLECRNGPIKYVKTECLEDMNTEKPFRKKTSFHERHRVEFVVIC